MAAVRPGPEPRRSGCRARRCSRPDPVRRRTRLAPLPLPLWEDGGGRGGQGLPVTFGRLAFACSRSVLRASGPGAASLWSASRRFSSQSASSPQGYVPKTSLSSPPWPEVVLPDPVEEARHHAEVVEKVNELIARGQYGRLFAVVHFASHQWKVTSEDLILIENKLDIAHGERIRLEKVRPWVSQCIWDSVPAPQGRLWWRRLAPSWDGQAGWVGVGSLGAGRCPEGGPDLAGSLPTGDAGTLPQGGVCLWVCLTHSLA
uniref:Large ribosomal subunit protein bL21m n=1 Tax=Bos mutus grunniens TaxID=30521 RepID=A0A8C0A7D5_BOSMU